MIHESLIDAPPNGLSTTGGKLATWYVVEFITSIGTTLLSLGIFFYMKQEFGWGMKRNFLLAAGQGAVYAVGALCANPLQARLGRERLLIIVYALMGAIAATAIVIHTATVVAGALLAYVFVAAGNWPALG